MSLKEALTPDEQKALAKLIKKRRKKLKDQGRFDDMGLLGVILGKVMAAEAKEKASEKVDLEATPKIGCCQDTQILAVTLTARTQAFCSLIVAVDPDLSADMLGTQLQALHTKVAADDFVADPEIWEDMSVSSEIASGHSKPDFQITLEECEGDQETPVVAIEDLRPEKPQLSPLSSKFYSDQNGAHVLLTGKDMALIHQVLSFVVSDYTIRNRAEEVVDHRRVRDKIGPRGARLLPQLRKLSDDDQAVHPKTGGSG